MRNITIKNLNINADSFLENENKMIEADMILKVVNDAISSLNCNPMIFSYGLKEEDIEIGEEEGEEENE
jgi:hypothetical protein